MESEPELPLPLSDSDRAFFDGEGGAEAFETLSAFAAVPLPAHLVNPAPAIKAEPTLAMPGDGDDELVGLDQFGVYPLDESSFVDPVALSFGFPQPVY